MTDSDLKRIEGKLDAIERNQKAIMSAIMRIAPEPDKQAKFEAWLNKPAKRGKTERKQED
jgi:hypothetical protein